MSTTSLFPIILTDLNVPWERMLALGIPMTFRSRCIISDPGLDKNVSGIYFIRRGCVRLSHIVSSGQEKIMLYMGQRTMFYEKPLFHRNITDYIFTSMETTEVVFLSQKFFRSDFIKGHPDLFLNLLESISKKMGIFYTQLYSQTTLSSFSNICRTLYSMYLFNRRGDIVVPRLTQQELASFLGLHRSSLHKTLTHLKNEGIIGPYSRRELRIYNPQYLNDCAEKSEDSGCRDRF